MNKNLQQAILIVLLILLSAGAAIGLRAWLHPPLHLQATELLTEPVKLQGQGYTLTVANTTFNLDIAKEHWLLVYAANSACQQENTRALQALSALLTQFDGVDAQYKPVVVAISLNSSPDPARNMETYAQPLHRDIQIFSGHSDELTRFAKVFGFSYDNSATSNAVTCPNHDTSRIYILDPQLRYIGALVPPHRGDILYSDMQQLTHQLWRYHVQR